MTSTAQSPIDYLGERPFAFACPACRGGLIPLSPYELRCATDGLTFTCEAGIWRFLLPARAEALAQFRLEYETVRRGEGRGSEDPAFYRALPLVGERNRSVLRVEVSTSERLRQDWAVRAQSFIVLLAQVVKPLARQRKRPLSVLDLGAGSAWLANRLAEEGHRVAAVDLGVDDRDGLGAHRHYRSAFTCLQAEFDRLPLEDNQVDLAIFNASFHYSVDYASTLAETFRVLRPDGLVVIVDTAVYRYPVSGEQMVAEREARFRRQYGFAGSALPNENFLTPARLDALAKRLSLSWRRIETVPGWRQQVRQVKVRLRRQREPAQFPIIVLASEGRRTPAAEERNALTLPLFSRELSVASRIGLNTFWLLLARVGQQGVLLLFTALVARRLGEAGLGQLAWITAVLYIGNVFSTFGLDTVLLRQIAAARRTDTVPLASALALELILAAAFVVFWLLVPLPGQSAETIAGLRLYLWALLPLAFLTLTSAALRGYERMGLLTLLTLGTAVLQLSGAAVVFWLGGGLNGLLLWLLALQGISAWLSWRVCRRTLPRFGLNWRLLNRTWMMRLAKMGFWLALLMVTAVLLQRLGILLLGRLGTEAQTGQLAGALRLVEAARLLPGALMGALFPVLARQTGEISGWRVASGKLQRLIASYHWGLLAYGILAAAFLVLLARPLVLLLLGEGFETAVLLLRLLAWGVVPFSLSLPLSVELVAGGAEKRALLATLLTLLGTAAAATFLFLRLGITGLGIGLLAGEWLLALLTFIARIWPEEFT